MSALAALPNWVMLERFVFRRDDEESFPDDTKASIRASGTTSWGASFLLAFRLAEPPGISRLYAQLSSGFPDRQQRPLAILTAHRHLLLIRVGMDTPSLGLVQDFFIFNASAAGNASSLTALPPCTLPDLDYSRRDGRLPRHPHPSAIKRLLKIRALGLLCRGEQEFAVAELNPFSTSSSKFYADIRLLRSHISADRRDLDCGQWKSMRVSILCSDNPDDTSHLRFWETDTVIPVGRWLCWIDYCQGILFCDVFEDPIPTVYFLRFPLDKSPCTRGGLDFSWLYRGASAIDAGCKLKFINVIHNDGISYRAFKPGDGFTITCYTLAIDSVVWNKDMLGGKVWEEDFTATSDKLWSINPPDLLPHGVLMFPQVDINRPDMVYFLISESECIMKTMWVATIDMNSGKVMSSYRYINGREDLGTEDADLTAEKSRYPVPFLSWYISEFLPRKRKHME